MLYSEIQSGGLQNLLETLKKIDQFLYRRLKNVILVPEDFRTIQEAIDVSSEIEGSLILIKNETYE